MGGICSPQESNVWLSILSELLFGSDRFGRDELATIREENIEYLSRTAWGNLVLNEFQGSFWIMDDYYDYSLDRMHYSFYRKGFICLADGIQRFFDEFLALGSIFAGYPSPKYFHETIPLSRMVLANCGLDPLKYLEELPITEVPNPSLGHLSRICREADLSQ